MKKTADRQNVSLLPLLIKYETSFLHHTAHSAAHRHLWSGIFFFLIHNHAFGRKEHTCDRCGIFESDTGNLCRVYHAGCQQVFVSVHTCVVAEVACAFRYFLYHYGTFFTCIGNYLAKRFFDSAPPDRFARRSWSFSLS